jgi:molybdopterin-guanine dinucleotide biosynthesis protein A
MYCRGILLTGGASTRMGRDKASIVLDGATLAERAGQVLAAATTDAVEVGPGRSSLPAVREVPPGDGPLAAIAAGAAALGGDGPAIVLACDMPLVTVALLRWLADHPAPGSVIPISGEPQPLCARWSAAALASIPSSLALGHRSLRTLLAFADVTLAAEGEWQRVAPASALDDVDSPADIEGLTHP